MSLGYAACPVQSGAVPAMEILTMIRTMLQNGMLKS